MKDRGELGCGLLLIVGLIAGGIYLLTIAPWLFIGVPVAIIGVILALLVLADVTTDDVLITSEDQGGFAARRVQWLNQIRAAFGKTALLQVPKLGVTFDERQMVKQATRVAGEVAATLRNSTTMASQRIEIKQQIEDVPANMALALWRLDRTRRMARSMNIITEEGRRSREELGTIEKQILLQMQSALDVLSAVPANLMRIEMAQSGTPNERLLTGLDETNQQLRELSAAYDEVRSKQVNG